MGKELTAPHQTKVTQYRRQAVANMIIHSIYKVDNSLNTSKFYYCNRTTYFGLGWVILTFTNNFKKILR